MWPADLKTGLIILCWEVTGRGSEMNDGLPDKVVPLLFVVGKDLPYANCSIEKKYACKWWWIIMIFK
jgi:hypothetical protein